MGHHAHIHPSHMLHCPVIFIWVFKFLKDVFEYTKTWHTVNLSWQRSFHMLNKTLNFLLFLVSFFFCPCASEAKQGQLFIISFFQVSFSSSSRASEEWRKTSSITIYVGKSRISSSSRHMRVQQFDRQTDKETRPNIPPPPLSHTQFTDRKILQTLAHTHDSHTLTLTPNETQATPWPRFLRSLPLFFPL